MSESISKNDLQIGDIGIMKDPATLGKKVNHVGIYVGNGEWMHCNYSRNEITIEKTNIFKHHRRFKNVEFREEGLSYMKTDVVGKKWEWKSRKNYASLMKRVINILNYRICGNLI